MARDIAHAKISEIFEQTGKLPEYVKDHPIYYAGPAKRGAYTRSASAPEDPCGLCLRLLRTHHGWPSGALLAQGVLRREAWTVTCPCGNRTARPWQGPTACELHLSPSEVTLAKGNRSKQATEMTRKGVEELVGDRLLQSPWRLLPR